MYDAGYAGACIDDRARADFADWSRRVNGYDSGEQIAEASGFAGASAGKLSVPFVWAIDALGANPWPGSAQERGDCVSHGTRNMAALTYLCEVFAGLPDEQSGKIETIPDMPAEGKLDGFLSSEAVYWWRRHGGDGWDCGHAAQVVATESGMWPRMPYPDFGVDLTRYSGRTAGKYGRTTPPDEILQHGRQFLIRKATRANTWEVAADFLANGNGVNSCGGQAWSSQRDENGYSPLKAGGWSHSEAYIGVDRRPWVQQKYGTPALFAMQNSWGPNWNGGPRDIHDSAKYVPSNKRALWVALDLVNPATGNLMIPRGCRWVDCNTLNRRSLYAAAGAAGWARKRLPNWGMAL